jgi:DNA-directed RNA polymerase specialized sigma24 family protein
MPMPVDEFTEFAAAVTPRLVRAAYLLTGDLGAAEDLVQEALVRTYRHGRRVLIDGALESYTRTTMYRLQLRSWRRRRFASPIWQGCMRESSPPTIPRKRRPYVCLSSGRLRNCRHGNAP